MLIDESGMVEQLKFKLNLNKSLDIVWNAWTKTKKIIEWFSPEAYIEPCLGGAYELFFDPANHDHQSTKGCKITVYEPMKTLAFTWKAPDEFGHIMNKPGTLTIVKVKFKTKDETTQIKVHHSGWEEGIEWSEAREWHRKAWEGVLAKLKSLYTS